MGSVLRGERLEGGNNKCELEVGKGNRSQEERMQCEITYKNIDLYDVMQNHRPL